MPEDQPDTGETDAPDQTTTTTTDSTDLAAEVEKWKSQARKHEERAKANAAAAKELEAVKQQSMTDTEKAVAEAVKQVRSETLATVGKRLVDAEVKAAAAGRQVDVDALLEGLDRGRFLTDDGEPDTKAIASWVDRIAPKGAPDLGQGARGAPSSGGDMNALLRRAAGRA